MRQLLIEAGIVEINSNGVAAFSVRRVAHGAGHMNRKTERTADMPNRETTMKEKVAEQGGLFSCAFKARNGRRSDRCLVRAHDAREARMKITKIVGCALTAFAVNAFVS